MTLRAKLEAVIYAAEEPVTLAQLAALFAEEAMEWKAEQEAAVLAAASTAALEPRSAVDEGLAYLGLDQTPEFYGAPAGSANGETVAPEVDAPPPTDPAPPEPGPVSAAESEAKAIARKRDREVRTVLRQILDDLMASYAADDRGVEIREIAGGFRMATKPACHDAVRGFIRSQKPPMKLSLPALETLAVIAYKQPVTAPEVNEIRGVDSSGVFGSLLSRKLITTAGRKQVIGRPILYKTTKEFLVRFGLKDVSELPSMEEFEKMAVELSELAEGEEDVGGPGPEGGPELDENASEEEEGESPHPTVIAISDPLSGAESEVPTHAEASKQEADPEPAPHD